MELFICEKPVKNEGLRVLLMVSFWCVCEKALRAVFLFYDYSSLLPKISNKMFVILIA